jgi:sensor histidine kinase YesM
MWFAYHFLWWTMRIGSPVAVFNAILFTPGLYKFSFYLVFQVLAVYFNLYFLIPKFLKRGKYFSYVLLLLVTIICTANLIVSGYFFGAWAAGHTFRELYGIDANWYSLFEGGALPSTAASMTLAMSIKLASDWVTSQRRQQQLEKEKLETELKFLRAQFNPHFLFNTINSIFVLINKNPSMASDALAKFSDLLRYQLYECNENEIPVRQELSYMQSFIELERLRHNAPNFEVRIDIDNDHEANLIIAPFVLIPFVENAFKHVSRSKERTNYIDIDLTFKKKRLSFTVVNSAQEQSERSREVVQHEGIGLKNVRRRLELIYPGQYELTVEQTTERFNISLIIDLHTETLANGDAAVPIGALTLDRA